VNTHAGENPHCTVMIITAPAAGIFIAPTASSAALVGFVRTTAGDIPVDAPSDSTQVALVVEPGQRVRTHQRLAWAHVATARSRTAG